MAKSSDQEMADRIIAAQKQQEAERKAREEAELRAKAQQMQEEQRKRLEEAKERIRARGTTPPQAAAPAPAARIYEVKAGDTLAKIAKQFYGDANRWHEIHEANRDAIPNPDLIQVGQKIRIP